MIDPLVDPAAFRARRREAWSKASHYWLTQPLRHVVDTGEWIVGRVTTLCSQSNDAVPLVVDVGCGSCWLLDRLDQLGLEFRYIGIDNNPDFISNAEERHRTRARYSFYLEDIEEMKGSIADATVVVNAYNFFEVDALDRAMETSSGMLGVHGKLLMSTIDKTYLILALSSDWPDFLNNLKRYQAVQGTKFGFQKIDLGDGPSDALEYPSVLYSTEDYMEAARKAGLTLESYHEQPFTATAIPKIYCHLLFSKE